MSVDFQESKLAESAYLGSAVQELASAYNKGLSCPQISSASCPVFWYDSLISTMDVAREIVDTNTQNIEPACYLEIDTLAKELLPKAIVISRSQTSGVGRQGRQWQSEVDVGVYLTIVFEDRRLKPLSAMSSWPLVVGCGVHRALANYGLNCNLKWPNDLVVIKETSPRLMKLGGILIYGYSSERGERFLSTGIGVNIAKNHDFGDVQGLSLHDVVEARPSVAEVAGTIIQRVFEVSKSFSADGFTAFMDEWNNLSALIGRQVEVDCGKTKYQGIVKGVNGDGALLLEDLAGSAKLQAIYSGEVSRVYVTSN